VARIPPDLPADLVASVERLLEGRSRRDLAGRAQRVSQAYRAQKPTSEAIRDADDALAYSLTRLPATYAAALDVLGRLREEQPGVAPRRVLDLGCGLGAAAFAALETWPNSVESVVLIDNSAVFLALMREIALASSRPALAAADIVAADLARLPLFADADLILVNYALTELTEASLIPLLAEIWRRCAGALVIVEPGTPRDYGRLMGVRAQLIAVGARIAAPCPHQTPCALQADDWCHFSTRLPRTRDHKLLKGAETPFEDEKFAYLVAMRETAAGVKPRARVIAPVKPLKYGVSLRLCTDDGIAETIFPKRDKPRWEQIRKCDWGDAIEVAEQEKP
jgi:ribosomal protein RSM22 (predicted rRNA methylase)